jgi:putative ABC transport system permease protein
MPPPSGELYSVFLLRFSLAMSDLLHALRALWRSPAFTLITVLILALGIGANTAIFSVVDAALLKPMPIPNPDRVVRISGSHPQSFVWFNGRGFEVWPEFMRTSSLDAVGAYVMGELSLAGYRGGRLRAAAVTPEVFDVLKVAPQIGRTFTNEDVASGSRHLALLSHELWQTHFNSATDILGSQIVLNRETFVVLGVMPRGFEMPLAAAVWVPSGSGSGVAGPGPTFPIVVARMAYGVTPRQALDEIRKAVELHAKRRYPTGVSPQVTPLRDTLVGEMRGIILLVTAGALIVLLVASSNIASLLLTRVSARQREFAVRRALGASERDIARQILTETLLLSTMAFAATIPIALWTLDAIRAWVPIRMYGAGDIALDGRAVAASAVFSLLTAMLFSAAPMWSARGRSAPDALRGASAATADAGWKRFRGGLAVAEIAFALVLLAGAVTIVRTVASLMAADLGVRAEQVLVVGVDWPNDEAQAERRLPFLQRYEAAFRALPGVQSVGITTGVPGAAQQRGYAELIFDGLPVPEKAGYLGSHVMASPEYLSIMGIDVLAGRAFTPRDHFFAPKVAVISESFALRYGLRPEEAVGRRAVLDHRWVDIVGVVRDVRTGGPAGSLDATAYVPFAQRQAGGPLQFVVKTHGNPAQLIAAARAAGMRIDPSVPLYDIRTFDQIREAHVRDRRFVMTMLSWFGGLAFVLAVLGLYAVVSYLVHLRTREIGIRMAMGATTRAVRMSVLASGVGLCLAGVVLGSVFAIGVSQLLSSRLRDFGELDLVTLSIVSVTFLAFAGLAAWLPARRATLIDPVKALRFD